MVTGTYTPRSTDPALSLPFIPGRPCLPALLDKWAGSGRRKKGGSERLGMVVCGPEGMVAEARHWAGGGGRGAGVDVHEEVFHW